MVGAGCEARHFGQWQADHGDTGRWDALLIAADTESHHQGSLGCCDITDVIAVRGRRVVTRVDSVDTTQ